MFLLFFFTIHSFDRRTDKQTNGHFAHHRPAYMQRGKNRIDLISNIHCVSKNEPLYCDDTFVKC